VLKQGAALLTARVEDHPYLSGHTDGLVCVTFVVCFAGSLEEAKLPRKMVPEPLPLRPGHTPSLTDAVPNATNFFETLI
jgi:hypothetical protein